MKITWRAYFESFRVSNESSNEQCMHFTSEKIGTYKIYTENMSRLKELIGSSDDGAN